MRKTLQDILAPYDMDEHFKPIMLFSVMCRLVLHKLPHSVQECERLSNLPLNFQCKIAKHGNDQWLKGKEKKGGTTLSHNFGELYIFLGLNFIFIFKL